MQYARHSSIRLLTAQACINFCTFALIYYLIYYWCAINNAICAAVVYSDIYVENVYWSPLQYVEATYVSVPATTDFSCSFVKRRSAACNGIANRQNNLFSVQNYSSFFPIQSWAPNGLRALKNLAYIYKRIAGSKITVLCVTGGLG